MDGSGRKDTGADKEKPKKRHLSEWEDIFKPPVCKVQL